MKTKKSISLLLGAGFSVFMGYPIAKELLEFLLGKNESEGTKLLSRKEISKMGTAPDGTLVTSQNNETVENESIQLLLLAIKFLNEKKPSSELGYENIYELLCDGTFLNEQDFIEYVSKQRESEKDEFKMPYKPNFYAKKRDLACMYKQIIAELLTDRSESFASSDKSKKYKDFLGYLNALQNEYTIHVHTLNHDLLFETLYH